MISREFKHEAVLLNEVVEYLQIKPDGIYVDATFGRGGHSKAILARLGENGRLLVVDKDLAAINAARQLDDKRIIVRHGSFVHLPKWLSELGLYGVVCGVLFDLGVSSPQLDDAARGFSFLHDGPLDMRMDATQKLTAADWLNGAREEDLADVFWLYGEERFSRRIARAIVRERDLAPILTTGRLAQIVKDANPRWEKHKHPATRVFMALRIFINDELNELRQVLAECLEVLEVRGRLLVISFHSLEDRIVKDFIKQYTQRSDIPSAVPMTQAELHVRARKVGKAVRASETEIERNVRSRSATLRIMEKIA